MALTRTSLASALNVSDNVFTATSATGATVGGIAMIDGEYSVILDISGTKITVRSRGSYGGRAVAHRILAPLTFMLASDIPEFAPATPVPRPVHMGGLVTASVNSDFDPGSGGVTEDTVIVITKATAYTATITGPTLAQDGLKVTYVSATAAAHDITYTAGFSASTTSSDHAVFAATVGVSMTLLAQGGRWVMLAYGTSNAAVGVTVG